MRTEVLTKMTGRDSGKRIFRSVLERASLASIRICISGGGPLSPEVLRRFNQLGIDFVHGYCLTETSPIVTLNPVEDYRETSVGKAFPGAEMRILDPDAGGRGGQEPARSLPTNVTNRSAAACAARASDSP